MIIDTSRITHGRRKPVTDVRPLAAASVMDQWADTLTGLVRSHKARLRAADPSRPWLSDQDESPGDAGQDRG